MNCRPIKQQFRQAIAASFFAALAITLMPAAAAAQDFMSEEELLATIPGSTIDGKTDKGIPWVQAYSKYDGAKKKGAIAGEFDGSEIKSTWYVRDGQWCEDWGDGNACWQVERVGKKKLRMYLDGKPRPNLWKLR